MLSSLSALTAVVLVAMDDEATPFLDLATKVGDPERSGFAEHRQILLAEQPVILVRTGIGFVNATSGGTSAILRHGVDVPLISAGSAGGLGKEVAVGDVVLGTRMMNTGADVRTFGYERGQVPGMPVTYSADPQLADAVRHAAPLTTTVVREGAIGSGEKFVTADLAERLRTEFPEALAVDMESAALAQLCFTFGVGFVSVRAISDLCAPDGTEFLTHIDDAAQRSALVVTEAIKQLASSRAR